MFRKKQRQGKEKDHRRDKMERIVEHPSACEIIVPRIGGLLRYPMDKRDNETAAEEIHKIGYYNKSQGNDYAHLHIHAQYLCYIILYHIQE